MDRMSQRRCFLGLLAGYPGSSGEKVRPNSLGPSRIRLARACAQLSGGGWRAGSNVVVSGLGLCAVGENLILMNLIGSS